MRASPVTQRNRGATFAAYDAHNPMLVVNRIWDRNKRAGHAEIKELVRAALAKLPPESTDAFIDYATQNCIARIEAMEKGPATPGKAVSGPLKAAPPLLRHTRTQTDRAIAAAEINQMRKAMRNAWLLEIAAPDGKPLGDCKRVELARFGGFYNTLSREVPPGAARLRDHKTGDDILKLMQLHGIV